MEKHHTVHSYDKELDKLRHSVIHMASLVKDLLIISKHAIEEPARSFVQLATSTDSKINHFDAEIENLAVHVLALRHPLAIDLRIVISALKLAVILERMGDLAKKVSIRIEKSSIDPKSKLIGLILSMLNDLERLLNEVIHAYQNLDDKLALKITKQDHIIDNFYSEIIDLIEAEIENNPSKAKDLLDLTLIARNFERIGDYVTKIGYITHYIITGDQLTSIPNTTLENN